MNKIIVFSIILVWTLLFLWFNQISLIIGCILGVISLPFIENEDSSSGVRHRNEWRNLRTQVLHRDNFRCSECKKYFFKKKSKLHIHHIVERSHGWEDVLSNLISLCEDCHKEHHGSSTMTYMHHSIKRKIIENAIENNWILHIDYRAESLWGIWTNSTRKIKPDKFYSENWHYYVSGQCYLTNEYRYFRVSRIIKFHQE